MKILVTGGRGFIGRALCAELERSYGHEVTAVDREDFDLARPGQAAAMLDFARPELVVHLAARYGRILCRDRPFQAVVDNAAATTELAAEARSRDLSVFYASSSEVYGDHAERRITEFSQTLEPTTIYGLSKRWGEETLALYLPAPQLTIARLNMVYGPDQRAGYGCCALATFIRDALEGRPLQVHDSASRSWLHIDDAAAALALLIDAGEPGIWNVANAHDRRSMVDVAQIVCDQTGARMEITQPPRDQIRHKNFDASRLESLGWAPTVELERGIAETIKFARDAGMRDYEEEFA